MSYEQTSEKLSEIMHKVLQKAKKYGATSAMVSINQDKGFSVDVRLGKVETVLFNEDNDLNVVLYKGHRQGRAGSTNFSNTAIDNMVKAASDIADISAKDLCFGLPEAELMTQDYPHLDLHYPWDITPASAIELAKNCEQQALNLDKRISNSDGVNVSSYNFLNSFMNSLGYQGITQSSRHSISCSLIAQEQTTMQRGYDYSVKRDFSELSDIYQLAQTAVKKTIDRLNARQIKTQKSPVLFSSLVSSSLLSSFINAISGNNLYKKNSFLLDSLGQQIFPTGFKIYEQPHLLKGLGSANYDGEGIPTRNNIFIEDGRLCQYVLNSYSARKLGLQATANSGGVHNLCLNPMHYTWQTLLKQMDRGLIVTELMGQGVNGLTGNYSRGARGFWVEQGEIQYPVEEITIAGNLKEMFRNVIAVGQDINTNIATRCGSLLIGEMMVAGY